MHPEIVRADLTGCAAPWHSWARRHFRDRPALERLLQIIGLTVTHHSPPQLVITPSRSALHDLHDHAANSVADRDVALRANKNRSVGDFESRTVLRSGRAVIVDAGGGDVGVAKPLLHLGDVGLMIERVGGGGRSKRMGTDLEAELRRIPPHQPVDDVGIERLVSRPVRLLRIGRKRAPFSSALCPWCCIKQHRPGWRLKPRR